MSEIRERLADKCWRNYLNARNDYAADVWLARIQYLLNHVWSGA